MQSPGPQNLRGTEWHYIQHRYGTTLTEAGLAGGQPQGLRRERSTACLSGRTVLNYSRLSEPSAPKLRVNGAPEGIGEEPLLGRGVWRAPTPKP